MTNPSPVAQRYELRLGPLPAGWSAGTVQGGVHLAARGHALLSLHIDAPLAAITGDRIGFRVTGAGASARAASWVEGDAVVV